MRKQLIKSYINKSLITVVPNALVIDEYISSKNDDSFRRELGANEDVKLIANIGRLSPEKGQEIFLRAAKKLLSENSNLLFILIGIGPLQSKLERLVESLGISDNVKFLGYRSDMINIYNSLDLVVQSSFTEGMPNVILEALLMKVPVIATDVGGTKEVMQHNYSGVLIESSNLDQLVASINAWVNNEGKFNEYGENGKKYVVNNFDHIHRVKRIEEIYQSVYEKSIKVN